MGDFVIVDMNNDEWLDIVVGEGMKINIYGLFGNCLVLWNFGNNNFVLVVILAG